MVANRARYPLGYEGVNYLVNFADAFDATNSDVFGTFLMSDGIFRNGFES